jgi:formate dehydrogenase maturation protein FdhE
VEGTTRGLRTASYLLRFTPDEKAELEQKVRRAAAAGKAPLSLADALRMGARAYLDELLLTYEAEGDEQLAGP